MNLFVFKEKLLKDTIHNEPSNQDFLIMLLKDV